MSIQLKSADQTHYDAIALAKSSCGLIPAKCPRRGRARPGFGTGAAETNVAEGLSYCFGLRAAGHHGSRGRRDWPQH